MIGFKMKPIYINSISIAAPSLIGMEQAKPILMGEQQWQLSDFPKLVPQLLPANERRRTTSYIKMALQVADEANQNVESLPAVFASSCGDLSIIDHVCNSVMQRPKYVSPIQFHNSVHNAPAGYWAIAGKSSAASTSISTGNTTFSSGLLEAVTQALLQQQDVLYVAYDYPATAPLNKKTNISQAFATAFVLSPRRDETSYGCIKLSISNNSEGKSLCVNESLIALQKSNPIADSLPLLEALCLKNTTTLYLPYLNNSKLQIDISQ
jgi:Beta-ketoacyl synthase, N-terminal domain